MINDVRMVLLDYNKDSVLFCKKDNNLFFPGGVWDRTSSLKKTVLSWLGKEIILTTGNRCVVWRYDRQALEIDCVNEYAAENNLKDLFDYGFDLGLDIVDLGLKTFIRDHENVTVFCLYKVDSVDNPFELKNVDPEVKMDWYLIRSHLNDRGSPNFLDNVLLELGLKFT